MPLSALLECEAPTTVAASGAPFRYSYETVRAVADDPIFQLWKGPIATPANKVWEIDLTGAVRTGIWKGTTVAQAYGGTGFSTYAAGDLLYASAADTLSKRVAGTDGHILTMVAGFPAWAANAQTTFSGAKVYKTGTQTGPGNDSEYTVTWDAETHDVGGYHDNASNNSRLTIVTTGYHRIYSALCLENYSGTNAVKLRFRVDGTTYLEEGDEYGSSTGSGVGCYTEHYLTAGQYVEVRAQCAGNITGGAGKSHFGISWIGA